MWWMSLLWMAVLLVAVLLVAVGGGVGGVGFERIEKEDEAGRVPLLYGLVLLVYGLLALLFPVLLLLLLLLEVLIPVLLFANSWVKSFSKYCMSASVTLGHRAKMPCIATCAARAEQSICNPTCTARRS